MRRDMENGNEALIPQEHSTFAFLWRIQVSSTSKLRGDRYRNHGSIFIIPSDNSVAQWSSGMIPALGCPKCAQICRRPRVQSTAEPDFWSKGNIYVI